MVIRNELLLEARIFGKFLIGENINDRAIDLYITAHSNTSFELDKKDQRLLKFMLKYPFWVGCIDGGLALLKRRSNLRKKIFFLLAILEADPDYVDRFLIQRKGIFSDLFGTAVYGIRGVYRAVLGCVLYLFL